MGVHANLLPNRKVLVWDATPDDFDGRPHTNEFFTTRVTLWTPSTVFNAEGDHLRTDNNTGTDLFCAGSSQLWNGNVVFTGGDTGQHHLGGDQANRPSRHANLYDYRINTWDRLPDMISDRWYSSNVTLGSGRLLTIGGAFTPTPYGETLETDMQWLEQNYPVPHSEQSSNYPGVLTYSPNGENDIVFEFLPHIKVTKYDTKNGGSVKSSFSRDINYRDYGSFAMFDAVNGKVLVAGGGDTDGKPSFKSSIVLDFKNENFNYTGNLNEGRRQHNLTIDAALNVVATGGHKGGNTLIDLNPTQQAKSAEIYLPDVGQWTTLNSSDISRQYHSIALLLPDASILSAGGGYCGDCDYSGYFNQNAEVFYPPYLFNSNGDLATRPQIRSPRLNQDNPNTNFSVNYAETFDVVTDQNNQIRRVNLIKLGSVTHSTNQEQRGVKLNFWVEGESLKVVSPQDRNIAPPGYYMLFVINQDGVPSVAEIIQVGQPLLTSGQSIKDRIYNQVTQHYEINMQDNMGLVVRVNRSDIKLKAFVGHYPSDVNNLCINTNDQSCELAAGKWQKVFISASADIEAGSFIDFTLSTELLPVYAQIPYPVEEPVVEEPNTRLQGVGVVFIADGLPWRTDSSPLGHCRLRNFNNLNVDDLATPESLGVVLSGPSYSETNFCDQEKSSKNFFYDGAIWRVSYLENGDVDAFCKYSNNNILTTNTDISLGLDASNIWNTATDCDESEDVASPVVEFEDLSDLIGQIFEFGGHTWKVDGLTGDELLYCKFLNNDLKNGVNPVDLGINVTEAIWKKYTICD